MSRDKLLSRRLQLFSGELEDGTRSTSPSSRGWLVGWVGVWCVCVWWCRVVVVVVVRTVRLHTCVCSYVCRRAAHFKWSGATRTGPFGWSASWAKFLRLFPPKAGSRRPWCKPQPTQNEEKGAEARPPRSQLLRRQGTATFSIALALEALGLDHHGQEHLPLDVISWLSGPVQKHNYHCYHRR